MEQSAIIQTGKKQILSFSFILLKQKIINLILLGLPFKFYLSRYN